MRAVDASALAIVNARVWTGDPARPWADAVVVRGDRIAAVGSSAEIRKHVRRGEEVIDAAGGMVVPGFIDAHVHFLAGGRGLTSIQLRDAETPAEFVRRVALWAATVPPGTWVTGGAWDHERWGGELPDRAWIDAATPNTPVWIHRLDCHMSLANSAALRAAGLTQETPEIDGGTIVRDGAGRLTGILKDNAQSLVDRVVPPPGDAALDRAMTLAMREVASNGVTAVHHMGTWEDLETFDRFHAAGRLRTRVHAAVPISTWARLRDTVAERGVGDEWLRIGSLKGFVDGSLGSHTAAMLEPYRDAPSDSGLLMHPEGQLEEWIAGADRAGLQVVMHAIGDRANRLQLDLFERVARENGPRDRRFRIEHAQHLTGVDIPRFSTVGVIASAQPFHAIDDARWAERLIGPSRARFAYAFRSLLDARARLAFGSDWPVAPPTPIEGIFAAVTRRPPDGSWPDGWVPEQRITVWEALTAYTFGAAHACFREADLGTLERGKRADLVMLDRDLTTIPTETLRDARVRLTVVGGEIVYRDAC